MLGDGMDPQSVETGGARMPVSDWPDPETPRDGQGVRPAGAAAVGDLDPRAAMRQARRLLRDLHAAATDLGDALVRAGFAPSAWREPDALLSELAGEFPDVTVDALLTRLAEFGAGTGPYWLAGDGPALDDLEREARMLASVIRPLRALAQRERMTPPAGRSPEPLPRALGDVRVGVQLDRLARDLQALTDLAPALAPLPPGETLGPDDAPPAEAAPPLDDLSATVPAAGLAAWPAPARLEPAARPLPETVLTSWEAPPIVPVASAFTPGAIPIEGGEEPDGPTYLMNGELPDAPPDAPTVPFWRQDEKPPRSVLGQRPHKWALVLLTAAALVAGTVLVTFASGTVFPAMQPAAHATPAGVKGTAVAGGLARATPSPSPAPPTPVPPTATPIPIPDAMLAVSPTSLTLPCPGRGGAAMTLANTGGRTLTWTASAQGSVLLSANGGTLDPGASARVTAYATGVQRGTITFRWSGGSVQVGFKVSCH
jgi:hypothetical protein